MRLLCFWLSCLPLVRTPMKTWGLPWLIQDNFPISRSLMTSAKSFLFCPTGWMFVPSPLFICWNLIPDVMGFGMGPSGGEQGMAGEPAWIWGSYKRAPSLLPPCEDKGRNSCLRARKQVLWICRPPELWRVSFCCWEAAQSMAFCTAARTDYATVWDSGLTGSWGTAMQPTREIWHCKLPTAMPLQISGKWSFTSALDFISSVY